VIVTAPAAFRFTYDAQPERHRRVAELLSGETIEKADENTLPEIIIQLMKDVGAPRGVRELGYSEDDIDQLVEGAMKQQRLLVGTPKEVTEEDLANILRESMDNW
jgi:alcohol dehydrogenase class IV